MRSVHRTSDSRSFPQPGNHIMLLNGRRRIYRCEDAYSCHYETVAIPAISGYSFPSCRARPPGTPPDSGRPRDKSGAGARDTCVRSPFPGQSVAVRWCRFGDTRDRCPARAHRLANHDGITRPLATLVDHLRPPYRGSRYGGSPILSPRSTTVPARLLSPVDVRNFKPSPTVRAFSCPNLPAMRMHDLLNDT